MPDGRVTHAESGGVHVLRYFGRVDYILAPAIKRFADDLVSHGDVRGWVFDLTHAEILDSTNLGLLARLAACTAGGVDADGAAARSVIVSTSDDINSVLRSMSFDQIFEIVGASPEEARVTGAGEDAIADARPSDREVGQTMLEAHRALIALSENGRLEFQDVVAALEADLGTTH
jgi:anti-anti-sigma regulatory factor